jgi:hypothetical protein
MSWRVRRAARLRRRADALDPGGAPIRLTFGATGRPVSATYEACCGALYLNTEDTGAPLYLKRSDDERLVTESTVVPDDHHGQPLP